MILVKQTWKGDNWKLGQASQAVHKQFPVNLQEAIINQRSQSMYLETQQITLLIHTAMELKEICPRGNNNIVIIIFLVHDNVYIPC
jgi:hypothetical protein